MMGRLQSRARNRVKRIIDFRTRVANKSDWAVNAVLNHFWSKLKPHAQLERCGCSPLFPAYGAAAAITHFDSVDFE